MATLIATSATATMITTSGPARLQIFAGPPTGQWLICDIELTGAQSNALATQLATAAIGGGATGGTSTTVTMAAQEAPLPGIYNAL